MCYLVMDVHPIQGVTASYPVLLGISSRFPVILARISG